MATCRHHRETGGRGLRRARRGHILVAVGGSPSGKRNATPVKVTVTNRAYWRELAPQLAQLLRGAAEAGTSATAGDPTVLPPDPERLLTHREPGCWSAEPRALAEVLVIAATGERAVGVGVPSGATRRRLR